MSDVIDECCLLDIVKRARENPSFHGCLYKKFAEHSWVKKYCLLYQNLVFEFDDLMHEKPAMIIPVEHCYAKRMEIYRIGDLNDDQISFYLSESTEAQRPTDKMHVYRAKDSTQCTNWIHAINESSYSLLKSVKEELEHRNLHLLRVVETERTSKWRLEEFTEEQRKQLDALRRDIPAMIAKKVEEALRTRGQVETDEIKKIKKIQSFMRGIICRRRWYTIVQDYIKSPHAESMRKRNTIVFQLVRSEEEYADCLSTLVSGFYRPFKMAASSINQPISHDEVNSIFLNSETLMFLHQIFLNGLQNRMESWPKLVFGDLFDMLLPMLSIYQEYVRNHHYSLQTLTDCKQKSGFRKLLKILEEKPTTMNRSLEAFLTYPMHRIPTYITTLQKLLSLTPFDHVERKALEHSQSVLEELSSVMHDEVSETENIRQNLVIERLFQDGCQLILDSEEVFIKEGVLLELRVDNSVNKLTRKKSSDKKELARHCFLFSKILLIASRLPAGKLQLTTNGTIHLNSATLIEDIVDEDIDLVSVPKSNEYKNLAFKIILNDDNGEAIDKLILLAGSFEEKASWTSDIGQCIENLKIPGEEQTVSIESRRSLLSIRSDPRLFTDSDDIKYSRALDSCRLPRIRHASIERLLERLLDVRFLSVEFLNTFLTTYSVFTKAKFVLDTITQFYYTRKPSMRIASDNVFSENMRLSWGGSSEKQRWGSSPDVSTEVIKHDAPFINLCAAPSVQKKKERLILKEKNLHSTTTLQPPIISPNRRHSSPAYLTESSETTDEIIIARQDLHRLRVHSSTMQEYHSENSSETSGSFESVRLNMASNIGDIQNPVVEIPHSSTRGIEASAVKTVKKGTIKLTSPPRSRKEMKAVREKLGKQKHDLPKLTIPNKTQKENNQQKQSQLFSGKRSEDRVLRKQIGSSLSSKPRIQDTLLLSPRGVNQSQFILWDRSDSQRSRNLKSPTILKPSVFQFPSDADMEMIFTKEMKYDEFQRSPKSPMNTPPATSPGVIVTSCRKSQRRSTISSAATAFAVATSGATVSPVLSPQSLFRLRFNFKFCTEDEGHIVTKRVLKILKHWVLKQPEAFASDPNLKNQMDALLLHIIQCDDTVPSDRKIANGILKSLSAEKTGPRVLDLMREPGIHSTSQVFDLSSSSQIAEQMSLLDHMLLAEVPSREFLSTSWMKEGKEQKAEKILETIYRFNLTSRLIASEILSRSTPGARASVIEKWAMVADTCRCLHNFNGVLGIITALTCSAIFRLKKSWEKVSKQIRILIEKLKTIVSADGRFRNMREALKCCDPPCVPYLGFYLTDLAFIEERTSILKESNLVNFAKMKIVTRIIQEIRFYQKTNYKIEPNEKILRYLLQSKEDIKNEEELYARSLELEPRRTGSVGKLKFYFPFGTSNT